MNHRVPVRIAVLSLACLVLGGQAAAATTWIGAQLNVPVPGSDVADTQLGADAGVTLTRMKNAYVGLGVDAIYHYWPASATYQAAFDRYLRSTRFEALDGPWAFTALQVTGHVKLVLPGRYAPWLQVGGGAYRINRNLDERRPQGTYAWVVAGPGLSNISVVPGGYGGVGVDVHASQAVMLGLDATFHYVRTREKSGSTTGDLPDFSTFTVGAHVLFGWN
jgi:hypothetical protein